MANSFCMLWEHKGKTLEVALPEAVKYYKEKYGITATFVVLPRNTPTPPDLPAGLEVKRQALQKNHLLVGRVD